MTTLSEEDELLKQLEKLRVASASTSKVDSIVDDKINYERKEKMLTGLYLIKFRLNKGLAHAQGSLGKPLVRSHLSMMPPHNLIQEVEPGSERLTTPLIISGSKGLDAVDNQLDRTLTYEEFSSRFEILVTAIGEGRLDNQLSLQPDLVIHEIMGLSGELLGRLSIDPKKGETSAMLEREMKTGEGEFGRARASSKNFHIT